MCSALGLITQPLLCSKSDSHVKRGHANKAGQKNLDVDDEQGAHSVTWKDRHQIVWRNVILMFSLHLLSVATLTLVHKMKPMTVLWGEEIVA